MNKLLLRYMQPGDIPQVLAIDGQSFNPPWSARSYAYEISESSYSHMVVLTDGAEAPPTGWRRWLKNVNQLASSDTILGYAGLWRIADEGHISTIATHLDYRRHGYGEILLAAMIYRAITLEASYIVLEVRVSNAIAQKLYHKYEFKTVSTKANYYRSDNEDAYDMRLDLTDQAMLPRFHDRYWAIKQRLPFADQYSNFLNKDSRS